MGVLIPTPLPFDAEAVEARSGGKTWTTLPTRIRAQVDAWRPEAVLVADGFFMKPAVISALTHYPVAVRYYAHELVCHRSLLHMLDGAPCPNAYPRTPDRCRACALEGLAAAIKSGIHTAWTEEYLAAKAYAPEFFETQRAALKSAACAVVSNEAMAKEARACFGHVFVVPGGVDLAAFPPSPMPERGGTERKIILMAGRGEDPAKGWAVLRAAGERLAERRNDFEIRVTLPRDEPGPEWFRPLGWLSREELHGQYAAADICVTPSLWEEPFGLVALEAMASGRPVCASRVGGLSHIVSDGETGILFPRGGRQCPGAGLGSPSGGCRSPGATWALRAGRA